MTPQPWCLPAVSGFLNRFPGQHPGRGHPGRLLLALALVISAACTDGYPREDEPFLSPFEMDRSQLLEAMNDIGKDAFEGLSWRYRLRDECVLAISRRAAGRIQDTFEVPLLGRVVDMQPHPAGEAYAVGMLPVPGESPRAALLETTSRMDALRMRLLTQGMQIDCTEKAAADPSAGTSEG